MSASLVVRILLDAMDELARAADHVPAPGRGARLGRLNTPGWILAHVATSFDAWINRYGQGREHDRWCGEWFEDQRAQPVGTPANPPFDEARAAFARVAERATPYLDGCDEEELLRVPDYPEGSFLTGGAIEYLLARAVAHLFAHAGELTVIASLVGRPDLGLPGALRRSTGTGSEAIESSDGGPLVVRLLLDAREQFARVADATPVPAQAGAFARLNSGGWLVAHVAAQDEQYWNVNARGLEPDPWLAAVSVTYGDSPSRPPHAEARPALDRTYERSLPYLEGLDGSQLDEVVRRSGATAVDQTVSDLVVRQLAHLFASAGELSAIASLAGAPDAGLPGRLAHSRGGA